MRNTYRGRLAPSPTGNLHIGHAYTFWAAQQRAEQNSGVLILRNEDLDVGRAKPEFLDSIIEDLHWLGITWTEGPDIGGPFGPYNQSERRDFYLSALETLKEKGLVYPCVCSRQDVMRALSAPHEGTDEPIYPGTCRRDDKANDQDKANDDEDKANEDEDVDAAPASSGSQGKRISWRFRVPDGKAISFIDGRFGPQTFVAGKDFGDFVVWRHDDVAAYQLAVVVDDAAQQITEVVRGQDLLVSTARQLLLYEALQLEAPQFYHCDLVCDENGVRLAKRHESLTIRSLRQQGVSAADLRKRWLESAGQSFAAL